MTNLDAIVDGLTHTEIYLQDMVDGYESITPINLLKLKVYVYEIRKLTEDLRKQILNNEEGEVSNLI